MILKSGSRKAPRLRLTCFGVGDGWPDATRNHSAYLYRFASSSWLIDCGDGLSRSYKAAGISYDAPDQLLLSHLHCDHSGGLFMFLQGLWLERRTRRLALQLPADGVKPIRAMLDAAMIFPELLHFPLQYRVLRSRQVIRCGGVKVTPFRTTHLARLQQVFHAKHRLAFDAFSFLLEGDGLRVGHSADIGAVEDLQPLVARPLDLLVCELAHCAPDELFGFLRDKSVRRLVLIHLAREQWANRPALRRLAKRWLPRCEITIARDGDEIQL